MSAWNYSLALPSIVETSGRWHHLAVTWTRSAHGMMKIYVDGLLRVQTPTGKTAPLKQGGSIVLGGEQDCYGGCTDRGQSFYGEMDNVRVWKEERTQEQILKHMRARAVEGGDAEALVAFWTFDDPLIVSQHQFPMYARDASGHNNHLRLISLPRFTMIAPHSRRPPSIPGFFSFKNNYAMNQNVQNFPPADFTVDFWARLPSINASAAATAAPVYSEFINFAAMDPAQGVLLDDALLIERYTEEFSGTRWLDYRRDVSTKGAVSVHINANRQGMGGANDHWLDFALHWVDSEWHHLAVSWAQSTGQVSLLFDGIQQSPFWRSSSGYVETGTNIPSVLAPGSQRSPEGSLILGNKQESWGGGFSPSFSLHGDLANVRVWNRVLSGEEVKKSSGMQDVQSASELVASLVLNYVFTQETVIMQGDKDRYDVAATGVVHNSVPATDGSGDDDTTTTTTNSMLFLGADTPQFVYSSAPLLGTLPLTPQQQKDQEQEQRNLKRREINKAMYLSDQQVLLHTNFQNFPSQEITVEFWMLSADGCSPGTPFSYAAPGAQYGRMDNAFLLFNYNDWGVAVAEDEGGFSDHTSGIASTDGKWVHVAVTWRSSDGTTVLCLNGRPRWTVTRARGRVLPSGGTLVIGREQDCEGGCFDSGPTPVGPVDEEGSTEYGAQDFQGLIDEMRIWDRALSVDEIQRNLIEFRDDLGSADDLRRRHPELVAYYTFDQEEDGDGDQATINNYVVKDSTGNGHDLAVTQIPRWEVVGDVLGICGNGIVEALEECDTGGGGGAEGCTKECKVERGWQCSSFSSPSRCWTGGSGGGGGGGSGQGSGGGTPGRTSGAIARTILAVLVGVLGTCCTFYAGYVYRFVVLDTVDAVWWWWRQSRHRGGGGSGGGGGGHGRDWDALYHHVADEEADFTQSVPPPSATTCPGAAAPLTPQRGIPHYVRDAGYTRLPHHEEEQQ